MKHIYIIDEHQSSKQNGVGTYIRQLLKCFEGSEHDVNLLSFDSDEQSFKIEELRHYTEYHIPICNKNNFLKIGALTLSILRLYITDKKDNTFFVNHSPCSHFLKVLKKLFPLSEIIFVIHDQGWCAPLLGNGTKLREILSNRRTPTLQKEIWNLLKRYCKDEKMMYAIADKVVTLATPTADLLADVYKVPKRKIYLIPNGRFVPELVCADGMIQDLRAKFGYQENEKIIFYAGRVVTSKGIFALLLAFEELYKRKQSIRLVIAGQILKMKECTIRTPFSSSHITYTGLVSEDDVANWCRIADVCILPSYTEQSSYYGIEMLASGKLIIATDGNNLTDMFDSDVALIARISYEEADFVKELLKQLDTAINMDILQKKELQERAKKRYRERYTIDIMRNRYAQILS